MYQASQAFKAQLVSLDAPANKVPSESEALLVSLVARVSAGPRARKASLVNEGPKVCPESLAEQETRAISAHVAPQVNLVLKDPSDQRATKVTKAFQAA